MKNWAIISLVSVALVLGVVIVSAQEDNPQDFIYLFKLMISKMVESLTLQQLSLEELQKIANKSEIINVQVNPNITLPSKECNWEKLNQKWGFGQTGSVGYNVDFNITKTIQIPIDFAYEGLRVLSGRIAGTCNSLDHCTIFINRNECLNLNQDFLNNDDQDYFNTIPTQCLSYFNEGNNNVTLQVDANWAGQFSDVYLEMEVKRANC